MNNLFKKFYSGAFSAARAHKIWAGILIAAIAVSGYFIYGKLFSAQTVTKYVLSTVKKGTLVSSVSGTGQISASHQIDLKPKVSGDISYVSAKDGDEVKAGAVIAAIDSADAEKAVRDAQANLVSAQISLQKTKLQSSQTVSQASADLQKAYDEGFTGVADAFLDLPSLISDAGNILYNPNHSSYMDNGKIQQSVGSAGVDYKYKIISQFESAKTLYAANLADYRNASRNSDPAVIEKLVNETQATVKALGDSIKNINNIIDYVSTGLSQKTREMSYD